MRKTNYEPATADKLCEELHLAIDEIWDSLEDDEKEVALQNEILDSDHAMEIYFGDLSPQEKCIILMNYKTDIGLSDIDKILKDKYSVKLRKGLKVATFSVYYLCPECGSMDIGEETNYCPECGFNLGNDKRK